MFHTFRRNTLVRFVVIALALAGLTAWATSRSYSHSESATTNSGRARNTLNENGPVGMSLLRLGAGFNPRSLALPDPTVEWNTFLGGSGFDQGASVALDGSGNIYLVGQSPRSWGTPMRRMLSTLEKLFWRNFWIKLISVKKFTQAFFVNNVPKIGLVFFQRIWNLYFCRTIKFIITCA